MIAGQACGVSRGFIVSLQHLGTVPVVLLYNQGQHTCAGQA
jgi:hypothetical protein